MRTWMIALIASLSWAGAAQGQAPGDASPYLGALASCRSVADATERASCYDRAYDALVQARARKDVVIMEREDVRRARRGLFGFSVPRLPFLGGGGDDPEQPEKLESTIRSVAATGYGRWRIVLEDGATWETTEPLGAFGPPRAGQAITIIHGALTNYFVSFGRGSMRLRAKRVG